MDAIMSELEKHADKERLEQWKKAPRLSKDNKFIERKPEGIRMRDYQPIKPKKRKGHYE